MSTNLYFAGGRFELADSEDPKRVEMQLAHSDGVPIRFQLRDGGTIDVHAAGHGAWVIEIQPD